MRVELKRASEEAMSVIPALSGVVAPALSRGGLQSAGGATAPRTVVRASPDGRISPPHDVPDDTITELAAADLTEHAFRSAVDHARLVEWAERIKASDRPTSWLVERPKPDGERPALPTAAEAYREMSAVVGEL
jgi:hypothetical protein